MIFWVKTVYLTSVLAVVCGAAVANECVWPDDHTQAAILSVATNDGSYASGVVIAPNRVLTAAHAVSGADQTFVRVNRYFRDASLITMDLEKDLAVMHVDTGDVQPIRLSSRKPIKDEPVWAVGYPHARFKTTSVGTFQDIHEGVLHTSASIDAGESGGGLLACDKGDFVLAGMLRGYGAYHQDGKYIKIENHSVSVTAQDIERFVQFSGD